MLDSRTTSRWLQVPLRTIQWASAVIVMGCVSYLIGEYREGEHLIYELVIAASSVVLFLPSFVHPLFPRTFSGVALSAEFLSSILWASGAILSLDIMLSYLWLTAFVFTAQDYNWEDCAANAPPGGPCSTKKATQSFTFLAFISSLLAALIEIISMWKYRQNATTNRDGHHTATPDLAI